MLGFKDKRQKLEEKTRYNMFHYLVDTAPTLTNKNGLNRSLHSNGQLFEVFVSKICSRNKTGCFDKWLSGLVSIDLLNSNHMTVCYIKFHRSYHPLSRYKSLPRSQSRVILC